MEWEDVDDGRGSGQLASPGSGSGQLAGPGAGGLPNNLDADGKPLPVWKARMRQRHRFWSTSHGFKVCPSGWARLHDKAAQLCKAVAAQHGPCVAPCEAQEAPSRWCAKETTAMFTSSIARHCHACAW